MNKKYVVRLADDERAVCVEVVKKLKGTSQKVRRAQILLKVDAGGAELDGRGCRGSVWVSGADGRECAEAMCAGGV